MEMLHEHGLDIQYDKVLEISTQLEEEANKKYVKDWLIYPSVLRRELFNTAALDNIDHNPTAPTATTFFMAPVSLF